MNTLSKVTIERVGEGWGSYCRVRAELEGEMQNIFDFYPDEIWIDKHELEGLTLAEAKELRYQRDVAYIKAGY